MQLSTGTQVGRYRIESPLGSGGMGEVYRAHDSVLDRTVALKILPRDLTADAARVHRFTREAKSASALTHPNILTIYDIGEATPEGDGSNEDAQPIHFISMELVEGETLGAALLHKVDLESQLDWMIQVAEGLAKAHEAGIVHRDLKPANIMISSDGYVKILDFGLAKLVQPSIGRGDAPSDAPTALRTEEGKILGTVGFMSPEQVEGRPADQRSDIFSIGCILYEVITGERAFTGTSRLDVLHQIVHGDPRPTATLQPDLSPELHRIVRKCLEKNPDDRYQSVREVAVDLRAIRRGTLDGESSLAAKRPSRPAAVWLLIALIVGILGGWLLIDSLRRGEPPSEPPVEAAPVPLARSLAVLPLDNLSGDEGQEYFALGMTDALTSGIGRLGGLRVISRSSASRYAETDKSLPEIAAELGVDFIVEGSVLRDGDRVRITVELVRASSDSFIWSESYEHDLADILGVQSEVARAVAREIGVALTPNEAALISTSRIVRPETFEAYLRGMHFIQKGTPESFEKGMEYLRDAVDADPADPLAYAGLATGYVTMGHSTGSAESFERAKAAALRAIELDASSAEAQGVLAEVEMYYEWDWPAAERAFKRALTLNPNHAVTNAHYAGLFALRGQWDEAVEQITFAQQLEPLAPAFSGWKGEVLWGAGRYDEAIASERKALELNPDLYRAQAILGLALADRGSNEEAMETAKTASENQPVLKPLYGRILIAAGRDEEAAALLEELTGAPDYPVNPLLLANFLAGLGDVDGALASLERAYETKNGLMPWIGSWFDWSTLADDPRYQALLDRMALTYVPRPVMELAIRSEREPREF